MRTILMGVAAASLIGTAALAQAPNAPSTPGTPPAVIIQGAWGTPPTNSPSLTSPSIPNSSGHAANGTGSEIVNAESGAAATASPAAGAPAAANGPSNPAIKTSEGNNANRPVAGANSFTEGQAKARIESHGYTNVSGLTKDAKGVWRGTARKDGKTVNVSLDFQGNVIAE